ncbi:MAG: formate/nitrite transporter family protein [Deltaproteobacteria bacterium]|nr:formate/nitrite transporter family protein [Deltaproteobacteria bacterium]
MAKKAEDVGVKKASLDAGRAVALGVLAGTFIALGACFMTTVTAGAAQSSWPPGVVRLFGGVAFSLGLVLVVIGGAELFTGNNLLTMAWASRRITTASLARNWALVFLGNSVGAFGMVALIVLSGQPKLLGGAVGAQAIAIAKLKMHESFVEAFVLGVLCNVLVCLAVWMAFSARTTVDRVVAVVPPIAAFVTTGFEHNVANLYLLPVALFAAHEPTVQQAASLDGVPDWLTVGRMAMNLVPVTLGNMVGGGLLVGATYWTIYLRRS